MRSLRVVVADGEGVHREELARLTSTAGLDVVGEAPSWDHVLDLVVARAADLVLVAGDPEYARGVELLPPGVATLAVVPDVASSKAFASSGVYAVVPVGSEAELLAATAWLAAARARDLGEARRQTEEARQLLETRKVVERAKGVLMRRLGVSEEEAYRRMQRASQDENRKMGEIAESILSAERLYGAGDRTEAPAEPAP